MKIVAITSMDTMSIKDFLLWELEGGKTTYETNLPDGEPSWDELSTEDKIALMAHSMEADLLANEVEFRKEN